MDGLLERDRELASLDRLISDAEEGRGRVALFVTPKTVEVHLSIAYRKLDIRSRRELPGALVSG